MISDQMDPLSRWTKRRCQVTKLMLVSGEEEIGSSGPTLSQDASKSALSCLCISWENVTVSG